MDRVEKVARALCIESGGNPDGLYYTGSTITKYGPNEISHQNETAPRWKEFDAEARRFIAAHDELTNP